MGQLCRKAFKKLEYLERHTKRKTCEKIQSKPKFSFCSFVGDTPEAIREHTRLTHFYKCPYCDYQETNRNIARHVRSCSKKSFKCDRCGQRSSSMKGLKNHVK